MGVSEKFRPLFDNPEKAFKNKFQQTLGQMTLPLGAPKHAKDIAASRPWTGTEPAEDQVHRMLQDSHKKLKQDQSIRLSTARENAIDYQFNPGDTFQERIHTARNTSSGVSTGGTIESIVNQHIEDAIARGQFDNISRGCPIDRRLYKLENPYIDTTELILNRIIKRQGAAPPWILKQGAMHRQVATFREETTKKIVTVMVHEYVDRPATKSIDFDSPCIQSWCKKHESFHIISVDKLNSIIRGYNLQAPQSARKGYLEVSTELERCFIAASVQAPEALKIFKGQKKVTPAENLHRALRTKEDSKNHYGLLDMLGWRRRD